MIFRAAFRNASETLDPIEAWKVLQPYWLDVVAAFDRKGLSEPATARVQVDKRWHDSCRHYAAMRTDGSMLCLAPQMADLPPDNIRGLLAHEAGHLIDFTHPGRYWYRTAARVRVREGSCVVSVLDVDPAETGPVLFAFQKMPERALKKHLRDWQARSHDEVERVADALGSWALGEPIGYTGSDDCLIQAAGESRPRPKGLR